MQAARQPSSTSIFFESATSFMILKVRIWLSARGSGAADGAGALPFQRAFNMEESCERSDCSGVSGAGGVSGGWRRSVSSYGSRSGCLRRVQQSRPEAVSSTTRPETVIAHFVLGDVLVDAGGDQLLHRELDLALFRVDCENEALTRWPSRRTSRGWLMRRSATISLMWTRPSIPSAI